MDEIDFQLQKELNQEKLQQSEMNESYEAVYPNCFT